MTKKDLINKVLIVVFAGMMISFFYVSNQNLNQKEQIAEQNEQLEFFTEDFKNQLEREDSLKKIQQEYLKTIQKIQQEYLRTIQDLQSQLNQNNSQDIQQIKEVDSLSDRINIFLSTRQSRNVLWVDDNPANNASIVKHLNGKGLNTVISLNNNDALEKLSSIEFELIISDMNRDGNSLEGIDLIESIRAKDNLVPIIIYSSSAAADSSKINRAMSSGANLVTSNYKQLINKVNKIVELNGVKVGFYFYPKDEGKAKSILSHLLKYGFSGNHQFYPNDEDFFVKVVKPETYEIRYDEYEKEIASQLKEYLDQWQISTNFKLRPVKNRTYGFVSVFIPE